AGFMRILGATFVRRFEGRLVNIHPSLLPAFPGLHTHRRAIDAGCQVSGATVHFVTADLDHGPIVGQAVVPVLANDSEATLAARVLAQEHLLYPRAIRWLVEGSLERRDGRVVQTRGESQLLWAP
ncbi:MAG TPA: formyltransferase family protein, partial [Caldimonas sp.]